MPVYAQGRRRLYRTKQFVTSTLKDLVNQQHTLAALAPGNTFYQLYSVLGDYTVSVNR